MRTTVTIRDDLLREAKTLAAQQGSSLGSVFEDALTEMLARRAALTSENTAVVLPSWGSKDDRPLVDILDSNALLDALDDGGIR